MFYRCYSLHYQASFCASFYERGCQNANWCRSLHLQVSRQQCWQKWQGFPLVIIFLNNIVKLSSSNMMKWQGVLVFATAEGWRQWQEGDGESEAQPHRHSPNFTAWDILFGLTKYWGLEWTGYLLNQVIYLFIYLWLFDCYGYLFWFKCYLLSLN